MNKYLKVLFFILYVSKLPGAIYLPIETTLLHKIELSSIHQNRVLVDGGRIVKAVYPDDGSVLVSVEEDSGQLFIHALTSYPPITTLSIITNSGTIQDIEISFIEKSSELVVLSNPLNSNDKNFENDVSYFPNERCWIESSTPEGIRDKIISILCGNIPCGYKTSIRKGPVRIVKKNIRAENIATIESELENLYVWRIQNTSRFRCEQILEKELSFQTSTWIYLEKNCLNPCETITAIVCIEK